MKTLLKLCLAIFLMANAQAVFAQDQPPTIMSGAPGLIVTVNDLPKTNNTLKRSELPQAMLTILGTNLIRSGTPPTPTMVQLPSTSGSPQWFPAEPNGTPSLIKVRLSPTTTSGPVKVKINNVESAASQLTLTITD